MPNDTSGPSLGSLVGTGLALGWLGLRAYNLYEAWRISQLTDEQRSEQLHVLQGQLHLRNLHQQQHQQQHQQLHQQQLQLYDQQQVQQGVGGTSTRVIQHGPVTYTFTHSGGSGGGVGGNFPPDIDALLGLPGMDGVGGIDFANLHLSMLDRDFTDADYEQLLALDEGAAAVRPVSQGQMDSLVHHTYRQWPARHQDGSSAQTAAASAGERSSGGDRSSAAACEVPTCSICLEDFVEGSKVLALPCVHQYHVACMEPWLKQQGSGSLCPVCKSPIFTP